MGVNRYFDGSICQVSPPDRSAHWAEQCGRLLIDSCASSAIFLLDKTGHVASWNVGAENITGRRAAEIIGSHSSALTLTGGGKGGSNNGLNLAESLGDWEGEEWYVRNDGSRFWADSVITALHDEHHELLGFGVIVRDATGRHNHLELLRQSEERLRLMIETVQDYAIFMLDPRGDVATWNAGAQKIKGYSSNEVIGRHFSIFYTPEDVATGKPGEELATARSCGRVEDEGWRVRRDGSRFWANVVITAVHDEAGTLRGFAKITRDMTERMQLTELERSRELAAQIQSTREDEQKRIARELHDDLGQQLTAFKMGTALLESNLIASGGARHLASQTQDLQKEVDSMMASVRRIASDLRPPVLDDLGLVAAVDWLADDFHHRYGVDVSARLEIGDLMFSDAAATAIFRIVQEALNNVAKHAQASEVTLEMTCSDSMCALSIEDDGQGVPLHAPRSEKSFGLLGMHERARQLDGTVTIDTGPGRGFRILVQFPIHAIAADATCQGRSDFGLD